MEEIEIIKLVLVIGFSCVIVMITLISIGLISILKGFNVRFFNAFKEYTSFKDYSNGKIEKLKATNQIQLSAMNMQIEGLTKEIKELKKQQ